MFGAIDPTFPLAPVACIVAALMLALVLLTTFVRQSWNLGIAFLCFSLFLETSLGAAVRFIWFDNGKIKHYIFCDIFSRLQAVCFVLRPMSTLIITRRLYLITSLRSVELPSRKARRRNTIIEWSLGLAVPALVAGPLYYIVQPNRFQVLEGFGCTNVTSSTILTLVIFESWNVIPPLLSVTLYYPRLARTLYRQRRELNEFLRSNNSVSRTSYLRIFMLASIDVLITLPAGLSNFSLEALDLWPSPLFYDGWTVTHSDWSPVSYTYAQLTSNGPIYLAELYLLPWVSLLLAFAIFGLFGLTAEARTSYRRVCCTVVRWLRWKPTTYRKEIHAPLGEIMSVESPQEVTLDAEISSCPRSIVAFSKHQNDAESIEVAVCDETENPRSAGDYNSDGRSEDTGYVTGKSDEAGVAIVLNVTQLAGRT